MQRIRWVVLGTAIAFTAIALSLVFTSDHESSPVFTAAANLIVAWSFIGCGFVALTRPTDRRFGLLMSAVGLSWFLGALGDSNHSIPYSFGQLFWALPLAFFIHALLVFPRGYLETKLVYATVAAAYGLLSLAPTVLALFSPSEKNAPANAFLIADSSLARTILGAVAGAVGLFVVGATIWVLARRWRAASRPLRRVLAPVFVTA